MHFEAALNLAWLSLGSVMLALAVYNLKHRRVARVACWLQLAGVLAIAGTLFPYVSATDDLLWMEANASRSQHESNRTNSGDNRSLVSLYQAADASLPAHTIRLGYVLLIFALLLLPEFRYSACRRGHFMGRSPPPCAV